MTVPLREVAVELDRIATEVRDVAARIDGIDPDRWVLARDLRAIAHNLERNAMTAELAGARAGEPDPGDLSWMASAAPGEIVEVMGR